jgi:hypothetical protein
MSFVLQLDVICATTGSYGVVRANAHASLDVGRRVVRCCVVLDMLDDMVVREFSSSVEMSHK